MHLESFLPTVREMGQNPYAQAFLSLHTKDSARKGNCLMMLRKEAASQLLPDSETQKEKEKEETSLFNA